MNASIAAIVCGFACLVVGPLASAAESGADNADRKKSMGIRRGLGAKVAKGPNTNDARRISGRAAPSSRGVAIAVSEASRVSRSSIAQPSRPPME